MMHSELPRKDVVLLGVGHTNAHVLRMWRMQPLPETRLTCVSNFPVVTYSGMLPGVLAGQYSPERMQIDLVKLCSAAGARLVLGQVAGIDLSEKRLLITDRPEIPFDVLSIGVGSQPTLDGVATIDESVVAIKPMQTFLSRLETRLAECVRRGATPLRVAIVGAGAGGVEIAFCLPQRLRAVLGSMPFEITLVSATDSLLGGVSAKTAETVRRELISCGVKLLTGRRVTSVQSGQVALDAGDPVNADIVLWATSAVGMPWLRQLGLPTDDQGFLWIRDTLQSTGHNAIFAVGDAGTLTNTPTPKAGVYAVRQGPILWDNIGRALRNEPLLSFRPQASFLKLLNTGDGRAVGEYRGWTFSGRWVWNLKDRIDRKFMDMFQNNGPMPPVESADSAKQMRCAGCGGKIGGSILSRALKRLEIPTHESVELGLDAPDDAAVLRLPAGKGINVSVDFFAAPLDDPYTVGRIAALHAASDCFATGAKPIAALASLTIPVGPARQQEQLLYELLAGALQELRRMNATLVGGHTIEGPQLTVGFTMLAEQDGPARTKGQLRVGDYLVLTKPLGTGVLLAALSQAKCRAEWFEPLLKTMLLSNQFAASLCQPFDIQGMTDVTGFGLAGHLLEMLRPSGASATLELSRVPLLFGVEDLLREGLESTLAPANRDAEQEIAVSESLRRSPRFAALFDPQTSGGMLLGVAPRDINSVLAQLSQQSDVPAAVIGRVSEWAERDAVGPPRLSIVDVNP